SDWFSGSRSVRSFCPCGLSPSHTFFTGFGPWHSAQMSRSHGPLRIPIFLASRQHGPDHAGQPGRVIYDWRHYLAVVQRKPGALRNGAPFVEMPECEPACKIDPVTG